MILSLLVTAFPSIGAVAFASPAPAATAARYSNDAVQADVAKEEEYKKRFTEAGADVAKLSALAAWCEENALRDQKRETYKRILEVDPNHEEAHKGLRHHFYDGKWFPSYAELSAYKKDEAKRMLDEKGLVRLNDQWVPQADAAFLRMDWVKNEKGEWVSKGSLERAKQEADYLAQGWRQQADLVWVSPEEFKNWDEGKWKCGDQWLSKDEANKFHASIGSWWTIPGQRFLVLSTCDYDTALKAANYADQTYDDLARIFGLEPKTKPKVVIVSSFAQYNAYAAGGDGRPQVEANGYSSCHYAFFGDLQFDLTSNPPEYMAGGVGFWDVADPQLEPFGKHSVRHAAAHSYGEATDPSWNTISSLAASQDGGFPEAAFWGEKKIPRWMRYGAASYVERYFEDPYADDPWWPRKWAISNLVKAGEIDPFDKIFAFALDPNDQSGRTISQAGLVVSFMIDGKCAPVIGAHRKLKAMLKSGQDSKQAVEELQKALIDNRAAFDQYVQLIQS